MPNAVLERLYAQRVEAVQAIDHVLSGVTDRDLVPAESDLLEATRSRITELDAQIAPLEAFDQLRGTHDDTLARIQAGQGNGNQPSPGRRADAGTRRRHTAALVPSWWTI